MMRKISSRRRPREVSLVAAICLGLAACRGLPPPEPAPEPAAAEADASVEPEAAVVEVGWEVEPPRPWQVEALPETEVEVPPAVDQRSEVNLKGDPRELSIAPDGSLWLTTREGIRTRGIYRAPEVGASWSEVAIELADENPHGDTIDRFSFFSPKVGIATGYIGEYRDQYLRTVDGGKSWHREQVGSSFEWIYDVFVGDGGRAWMGGSKGRFLYTDDAGESFTAKTPPFDHSTRTYSIFMASPKVGVVGSLSDGIKLTDDGGDSWRAIPTPHQQKLTGGLPDRAATYERIDEVGLYRGWVLAQQAERVFAAKASQARWQRVGDLIAFAMDGHGALVVGVTTGLEVVALDGELRTRPLSERPLSAAPVDIRVVGERVYIIDEGRRLTMIEPGAVRRGELVGSGSSPTRLGRVRRWGEVLCGVSEHHLYISGDRGETWARLAHFPRGVGGFEPRSDGELLLWDREGNASVFDRTTAQTRPAPDLDTVPIHAVLTTEQRWLALGGTDELGATLLSTDRGSSWEMIDLWSGGVPEALGRLSGGGAVIWSSAQGFKRIVSAAGELRGRVVSEGAEVPRFACCTSLYFATDQLGYLGGYVHHGGDQQLRTTDGGESWERVDRAEFPFVQVVPFGDRALAIEGATMDRRSSNRRRLWLLSGRSKQLIHTAAEAITDVSVTLDGQVLLELDADPDPLTPDDKSWSLLVPPRSRQ